MSEALSRRSSLQLGSSAPLAAGVLSTASSTSAGRSDVASLWETYTAIRNEGDQLHDIWFKACERASAKSPDLPEGLAFPNPQFSPWLQIDRDGVVRAVRCFRGKLLLHYRPEVLADFFADPPEMNNPLDAKRVPRILAIIRDLLPKAESYMAAVKEVWREADEIEAACSFDELNERQDDAETALMDAAIGDAKDFVFKAKLIRTRLADGRDVAIQSRKLAEQIISFWGTGANG